MRSTILPLLLLSTAAPALPQATDTQLEQCLLSAAEKEGFSGSIAIWRGDAPVIRIDRGRLGGPETRPIDASTRFNLGSVSKMFTAVAIGQLIDAGRLRLDQPVGEVVTGLTPEAGLVTIRQLLTHTSGLGSFFRPENMDAMLRARTASDLLPLLVTEVPEFTPGSRFSYSNSGFALLGIVIERLSGLSYSDYLRQKVLKLAGMTSTGPNPQPLTTLAVAMTRRGLGATPTPGRSVWQGTPRAAGEPGTAQLMLVGPDGRQIERGTTATTGPVRPAPGATENYGSPAGGIFSTNDDLARFARALLANKLLKPATAAQFMSPQYIAPQSSDGKPGPSYGFGFGFADNNGVHWVGHNGGAPGANAEFWFDAKDQWIVSVIANRDPPVATNLVRQARELVTTPNKLARCGD